MKCSKKICEMRQYAIINGKTRPRCMAIQGTYTNYQLKKESECFMYAQNILIIYHVV